MEWLSALRLLLPLVLAQANAPWWYLAPLQSVLASIFVWAHLQLASHPGLCPNEAVGCSLPTASRVRVAFFSFVPHIIAMVVTYYLLRSKLSHTVVHLEGEAKGRVLSTLFRSVGLGVYQEPPTYLRPQIGVRLPRLPSKPVSSSVSLLKRTLTPPKKEAQLCLPCEPPSRDASIEAVLRCSSHLALACS